VTSSPFGAGLNVLTCGENKEIQGTVAAPARAESKESPPRILKIFLNIFQRQPIKARYMLEVQVGFILRRHARLLAWRAYRRGN
jgi:hypothetical protein